MKKINLGIIGCGNIGKFLTENLSKNNVNKIYFYDVNLEKAENLKKIWGKNSDLAKTLKDLVECSELVIECANVNVVEEVLKLCKEYKKNVVIMSVGGLILNYELFKTSQTLIKIYIPEGAIFGLDIFKALKYTKINSIELKTYKSPKSLEGAPFLKERNINLYSLKEEASLFEGNLSESIKNFPQNINIAATLGIISGEPNKIKIKILCSPSIERNIHHILIDSEIGRFESISQNIPSNYNPKTSALALFSCLATTLNAIKEYL